MPFDAPHATSPSLWALAWRRLRSDVVAMISLAIVILFLLQMVLSGTEDRAREERIRTASRRAYDLDPDLPEANVAMGLSSEPLADALNYFRRAIDFDASDAEAYHQVGDAVIDFDPERAVAFFRRSLALDPRQEAIHAGIIGALGLLGRDEEARDEAAAAARGSAGPAARMLMLNDLHQQRYPQAAAALGAMPNLRQASPLWATFVSLLRMQNRADDALAEASALAARFPRDCEARSDPRIRGGGVRGACGRARRRQRRARLREL